MVFDSLEIQENHRQHNRRSKPRFKCSTLIFFECVVRKSHRHARRDQKHRVEQWQVPWINNVLSTWELFHVWCLQERPRCGESFPQHIRDTFSTLSTDPGHGEGSHVEERAKECSEEHHFREDEPKHPLSIRAV